MNLINKDFNKNFYFFRLPKKLFKAPYNKLSSNAKLCYMLLLDRTNLSKVNKHADDEGNVYIYYTRENMQKELNISKVTAIKVFKELVQAHLLKQVKHKHVYRIYLYDIFDNDYEVQESNPESINFAPPTVQNLYPNNNSYNNTYKNKSNSFSNYKQREYPEGFFDQFYENLK